MTGIGRTAFLGQDRAEPDILDASTHNYASAQISFEQSMEAYKLAVQSSAVYSCESLVLSGTWQKYEQRAASIAGKHPSRNPFISYLSLDDANGWTSSNSRQSYRSALIRMAAQNVLELIPIYWRQVITDEKGGDNRLYLIRYLEPRIDENARNRMRDATGRLPDDKLHLLRSAISFLLNVSPDPYHTALRETSPKQRGAEAISQPDSSASKKDALYALNRHQRRKAKTVPNYDWRSHLWSVAVIPDEHLDDHRRACIATLMLTGCRPSEFCDDLGVTVRQISNGEQASLRFEIAGAKVSDEIGGQPGKGQEHRQIDLICQTPEAIWLLDYISGMDDGAAFLELPAPRHKQTGEALMPIERHRRVSVSLGKLVARLGKIAFPNQRLTLTPYVFRHAFTSDFKAGGHIMDECDLAAALGHQSARTQEHYGNANTARGLAGSRVLQITQVKSSTPVRQPTRPEHPSEEHSRIQSEF